jgi:chitosanase
MGGEEKGWITAYVLARQDWLANHPRRILHGTVYRTRTFMQEIQKGNWDLSQRPIKTQGLQVRDLEMPSVEIK